MFNKRESSLKSHLNKEFLLSYRLKNNLSLRKIQVEEYIEKKRFHMNSQVNEMEVDNIPYNKQGDPGISSEVSISNFYNSLIYSKIDKKNLNDYVLMLYSEEFHTMLTGIVFIRKILSEPGKPPIEQFIKNGSVTHLFEIVRQIQDDRVVGEILWIFTNIASSEHIFTKYLYHSGIIDIITNLLSTNKPVHVKDQLIWLIANIAGDHHAYRSEMIDRKFHEYIIKILMNESSSRIHKNCFWSLSNMLRGAKRMEVTENLSNLIVKCCKIINSYLNDVDYALNNYDYIEESIPNILNIITNLTENNSCLLGILIKFNTAAHLIQMLDYFKPDQISFLNVLRILGNFSANEHIYTTEIVENDILSYLKKLLEETDSPRFTKEICWILSNIAADNEEHAALFFETEGLIDVLFNILKDENVEVKKEAIWCVSNLTTTKRFDQMNILVEHGIIKNFNEWMSSNDNRIPALIMEALVYILKCFNQNEYSRRKIYTLCENFGIINKLEILSTSKNDLIRQKSEELLDTYFLHYKEGDQDDFDFEDHNHELLFCSGNEVTVESDEIVPIINSIEKGEKEKNKENYPAYDESDILNDSNTMDYSRFI